MLNSIPVRKASGSDGMPTVIYKLASNYIAKPLAHLINLSIQQRVVPTPWKLAHVIAIPKCIAPSISDLRPVSLLPLPAKLLEKVVYNSLKHQFVTNFGKEQFGF